MPKKTGGGSPPDKIVPDAVANLHILVHLQAQPIVAANNAEFITALTSDPKTVRALVRAAGEAVRDAGGSYADVKEAMKEAKRLFSNPGALVFMATVEAVTALVTAWLNCLLLATRKRQGVGLIKAEDLGPDMLPQGREDIDEFFDAVLEETPINGGLGREILIAVRKSLPAGIRIPREVIVILGAHRIIVVP